mmetsp:Transcript_89226/g.254711  ORF Transcript_89226/g.254711 Transcript_89226/m.254711 type:complete len:222 (+) Transcript_89226:210-875(+)
MTSISSYDSGSVRGSLRLASLSDWRLNSSVILSPHCTAISCLYTCAERSHECTSSSRSSIRSSGLCRRNGWVSPASDSADTSLARFMKCTELLLLLVFRPNSRLALAGSIDVRLSGSRIELDRLSPLLSSSTDAAWLERPAVMFATLQTCARFFMASTRSKWRDMSVARMPLITALRTSRYCSRPRVATNSYLSLDRIENVVATWCLSSTASSLYRIASSD